jgi:hypothetical protein
LVLSWKVGVFAKLGQAINPNASEPPVDHNSIPNNAGGGPNFQPKAILLFSPGTNSALVDILRPGMGVSSGATANRSVSWGSDDEQNITTGSTNAFRRTSEEYCFMLGSGGSANYPKMKVKTFNSDGSVTFTYDQNDALTYNISYVALGGADITNVKAGSFNLPTTPDPTFDVTNVGFQPDFVLFFGANDVPLTGATTNASSPHAIWFMGAATDATHQHVVANTSLDGVTGTAAPFPDHALRYQRVAGTGTNPGCIALFEENSTATTPFWAEAKYVGQISTGSGGFRLNVTTAPTSTSEAANRPIFYLAVKGGSWGVGNFTAPTSEGNQTVTGVGNFTPKGVMLYGSQGTSSTSISTAGARFSVGASGATVQWNVLGGDDNTLPATGITETIRGAMTGTIPSGALFRSASETITPNAATDVTSQCGLSSFGSGQFIVNWSIADAANARQILYLAVGDSPVGTALIKLPTPTPESVGITETVRRPRKLYKKPATTPEQIGITESTGRARGIIRVLGNVQGIGGGFTDEGFLLSGFTTPIGGLTTSGDYSPTDFVSADYVTEGGAPPPDEGVLITETVVKKITPSIATITAVNITLRYSGGASYNGAIDTPPAAASVGGVMSSYVVANDALNSAWDDINFSEATAGESEYRCFYVRNSHTVLTAYDVRMWIDTNSPGGDSIQIAVGAALQGQTEQTTTNENTAPSTNPIFFTTAPDENSAIILGDIPAGGYRAIWIKRIVPASTIAYNDNLYRLMVSFASDETST